VQIWNSASSPKELQKRAGKCEKVQKRPIAREKIKSAGKCGRKICFCRYLPGRAILICKWLSAK
jgi:hypothetical protein